MPLIEGDIERLRRIRDRLRCAATYEHSMAMLAETSPARAEHERNQLSRSSDCALISRVLDELNTRASANEETRNA